MKITLIVPTGTDPRSPQLAVPSLAAFLRRARVPTDVMDLDLGGLLWVLAPPSLRAAGARLRQHASVNGAGRDSVRTLLALAEQLPERCADALATFWDAERFFDANELLAARETIMWGLELVSTASPGGVQYSISPTIAYDVAGVDTQALADLIRVTGDPEANLFAEFWSQSVYPRLAETSPDVVGITITNRQQIIPGLTLARELRRRGHFVILGGALYSKFREQLLRAPDFLQCFADGVVVYEGETALIELASQLSGKKDFSKVPNFLYLEGGTVRFTRPHVEDVAALPTPDFTGLPLDRYLSPKPVLPILFGKGCYFNRCKFCDIPFINHISTRAYRIRPVEQVVADLLELNQRYGCRHFEFTDEALPPRLLEEFCDALEPHGAKQFSFVGYARLEAPFNRPLCAKLARAGMRKLFFGLEAGAQETLDHMDKGIRLADARAVLQNCDAAGIRVHLFVIVGFPEESEELAWATYRFLDEIRGLLDHPGNSFEVNPFGLPLRTRYFEDTGTMGVAIAPEALAKEFALGIDAGAWTNPRGMAHERVEALVAEFRTKLRVVHRRYHAWPENVWPLFEQYSVLYAERYAGATFPFTSALPAPGDPLAYRLRWNPAAVVEDVEGGLRRAVSRNGAVTLNADLFRSLGDPIVRRGDWILGLVPDADRIDAQALRAGIDELVRTGLLQVVPHDEGQRDLCFDPPRRSARSGPA